MLGTIKSLATTMRLAFRNKVTVEYPTERPVLAPRFMAHPVLTWDEAVPEPYCTGCLICMRICPTDVITVSMKDNPKFADKDSTRRKIVDEFELNVADCIMCGLCVDYCNFDAIVMSDNFDISKQSRTQLVQGLEELLEGGRDQVARGRWSPPETKKSERRSAAQGRTSSTPADSADAPSGDDRVAAARARAAELRAQRARESGQAAGSAPADAPKPDGEVDPRVAAGRAKAAELRAQRAREQAGQDSNAGTATPSSEQPSEQAPDPRVVEARRRAAELRAQRAQERAAESPDQTAAGEQTSADPRVVEARRKAAELRAQRAREREEPESSGTDEAERQ